MKFLTSKIILEEKNFSQQNLNKIADNIYETLTNKNKRIEQKYNEIISKTIEINEKTNPIMGRENPEFLEKLNQTIDYLTYNKNNPYLKRVINNESRKINKEKINFTLENLKKIRNKYNNETSEKSIKYNLENMENLIANKIPGKNTLESRLSILRSQLDIIKNKQISQEDFDKISYNYHKILNNRYLKNKTELSQKRNDVLSEFSKILEQRNKKQNKIKKKKPFSKLIPFMSPFILAGLITTINPQKEETTKYENTNSAWEVDIEFQEKKNNSKPNYTITGIPKHDSIYKARQLKFDSLFTEYANLNTPKNLSYIEFKAILTSIALQETSMGASRKAGKEKNEPGEFWLMGFTRGEQYPEKYKGIENQIKSASERIKEAFEGKQRFYPKTNEKESKEEKIKYILSVYNSGKDLTPENKMGQNYVKKVFPLIKGWEKYFKDKENLNYIWTDTRYSKQEKSQKRSKNI